MVLPRLFNKNIIISSQDDESSYLFYVLLGSS